MCVNERRKMCTRADMCINMLVLVLNVLIITRKYASFRLHSLVTYSFLSIKGLGSNTEY